MADTIQEIFGAVIALIVVIFLFFIFYTTQSPIQASFQKLTNNIIYAVIAGVVIAVIAIIFIKYLGSKKSSW